MHRPLCAWSLLTLLLILLSGCSSSLRYVPDTPPAPHKTGKPPVPDQKAPDREIAEDDAPRPEVESADEEVARPRRERVVDVFHGNASYYGPGFNGKKTANGERFDMHALTAAHRTLPFGTWLRVTNVKNNKSVVVRINDRGPFKHGRVLDLSLGAAKVIGLTTSGVGRVKVEVLQSRQ